MKHLSNSVSYCVKEKKPCVKWVEKYFKDCLCNVRDEFSFGFGFISLVCWGIAEIPQIVTNFRTKSSHGLSFLFLITWITGDVFNLVGCVLEPATLPTQFYTAVLYTTTTVVLVLQTLYYDHYDHLYAWLKCQRIEHEQNIQEVEEEKKTLKTPEPTDSSIPILQPHTELYYTSARSLARSSTPPTWSYLRTAARSGPSGMGFDQDGSSSEDETIPSPSMKPRSKPNPIPRSAGSAAFLAATVSLPQGGMALMEVYVGLSARRLLHVP